ncbi:MAG TPA: hypothetical protein VK990_02780 [Acidimicrobiia bacterium]|nr:hypothetical protein [Acidimicrobiia bacterium]
MSEPSPRQVLYALVAGGFVLVVGVLIGGAAVAGLVPTWWTIATTLAAGSVAVWSALNWRRTAVLLMLAIGLFLAWTVGTLVLAA